MRSFRPAIQSQGGMAREGKRWRGPQAAITGLPKCASLGVAGRNAGRPSSTMRRTISGAKGRHRPRLRAAPIVGARPWDRRPVAAGTGWRESEEKSIGAQE